MTVRVIAACFAAVAVVACSSSAKHSVIPVPTSSLPSTVVALTERDALQFRVVQGSIPYTSTSSTSSRRSEPPNCQDGKLVTPRNTARSDASVTFADRHKTACYALGPVVLTGHNIATARAVVNQTTSQREVDLHFSNDDFVTKVAQPYVNQEVAIVLDAVVESVPTINAGITGRDITFSGDFDEATARAFAKKLS